MKYRKKPIVIEAVQFWKHGDHPAVQKIPDRYKDFIPVQDGAIGYIENIGNGRFVMPGDFIVSDEDGKIQSYSPAYFLANYEKVD